MALAESISNKDRPEIAHDAYERFEADVRKFLPSERIVTDALRRFAFGVDASFYRLTPKIILLAENEEEVRAIIAAAAKLNLPITFRAAGTSLSGQSVTDSILVKLGFDGWRDCEVSADAETVRVGPGLTGAQVNRRLARYGRKIGPDPASINSAMIGGIAANNASGMCCGIAQNSYQTLHAMRVVLADGTLLDTGDQTSRLTFQQSHAPLLNALRDMGTETRNNPELSARITKKFAIKNTMGYSINALVDYEDPIDILQHLMIGSEGTLGFISEITYKTVADPRHKASALAFFPDIRSACKAVAILKSQPVSAVELMDFRALSSVRGKPGMPEILETMPEGTSALLIEVQGETQQEASAKADTSAESIASIQTLEPVAFAHDPETYMLYWKMRKGLFPAVGAVRETGTTVIIEDVAVTTDQLADAVLDLQNLFEKHSYDEALIFGHALEGNVHFVFTQGFASEDEVNRYGAFMDDVVDLVVKKYDGSLKAEHSTGRNMAPFVEMEWGTQAYNLMSRIKTLFDPQNVLNPGVIFNDNPKAHIENLKPMPAAHEIVDKCIECGFCEATCPSRAYTLTPRQRIVSLREISRLGAQGLDTQTLRRELENSYKHEGVDSCAGDGLCSIACPVGIDTGQAMREMRAKKRGPLARFIAARMAGSFGLLCSGVRVAMVGAGLGRFVLGDKFFGNVFGALNRWSGGAVPIWPASMPTVAPPPARVEDTGRPKVVYMPSCASRVFGPASQDPEQAPLPETMVSLLRKAGYDVVFPQYLESLCCGMPFNSKGFLTTGKSKLDEMITAIKVASKNGEYPVVFDTSPCAMRAREAAAARHFKAYDLVEALDELILPNVEITPEKETIAVHTTCSARRMGLDTRLKEIAEKVADDVVIPPDIQCCGFAGDKGFNVPDLNASALRHLASSLPENCNSGYSTSRTCEIGLSTHAGRPYQSIAYLVDRCAKEKRN